MHPERFHVPQDPVPGLAIFITTTDDGTHTGILHRIEGTLFIQDVLWHEMFRSSVAREKLHFVVPGLREGELNDLRAMCRLIHFRHNERERYRIPYAFRHGNNARFDANTGELYLGDGLGLSCSTFVLTVFESMKVPLIVFDGWKVRPEDNARHDILLSKMEKGIPEYNIPPAKAEHVALVKQSLPCNRVKPEEVAGSGMYDNIPIYFPEVEAGGEFVFDKISGRNSKKIPLPVLR